MMSPTARRAVILGMLALFLSPIVLLGVSPADRVHGLSGPYMGTGLGKPSGGLLP